MEKINECFRYIRTTNGFSQEKMADILKVSKKTYVRLEHEETGGELNWILKTIDYFGDDATDVFIGFLITYRKEFVFGDTSGMLFENKQSAMDMIEEIDEEMKKQYIGDHGAVFHRYLEFKKTGDLVKFQRDIKKLSNYLELKKSFEILPMLMSAFDLEETIDLLSEIQLSKVKNVKNRDYIYVSILLNGIGTILDSYSEKHTKILVKYLFEAHEIIQKGKFYYLLPLYYRHKGQVHLKNNEVDLYNDCMSTARNLAVLFRQENYLEHLDEELKIQQVKK